MGTKRIFTNRIIKIVKVVYPTITCLWTDKTIRVIDFNKSFFERNKLLSIKNEEIFNEVIADWGTLCWKNVVALPNEPDLEDNYLTPSMELLEQESVIIARVTPELILSHKLALEINTNDNQSTLAKKSGLPVYYVQELSSLSLPKVKKKHLGDLMWVFFCNDLPLSFEEEDFIVYF